MKYFFSGFVLDTEIKALHYRSKAVPLTRQSYLLLLYLLENNTKIHTKDELVAQVWQGRIVSDNTVDQSISKLRKVLNDHRAGDYIEAVYGQGVKFVPKVSQGDFGSRQKSRWLIAACTVLLLLAAGWFYMRDQPEPTRKPQMIITVAEDKGDWVQSGTEQLLSQMLNYSGMATVIDLNNKPKFVTDDQFIQNQQRLNPNLQTVQAVVTEQEGLYRLSLTMNQLSKDKSHQFEGKDLSQLMSQAMDWMSQQINTAPQSTFAWLPANHHVAELYLRAMYNIEHNEFEKARKQLDLIIEEAPQFYLAKYQLAQVLSVENKHDESLAMLNTLIQLDINDEIRIASVSLKAYILDTLGQYDEAIALYDELFSSYRGMNSVPLLKARYEYSYVLINTNQTERVRQQLDLIIEHLQESDYAGLLADVRALKGSLLQRLGQVEAAKTELTAALDIFERNNDALGTAKTFSALARIANQQANYVLAESYLKESLDITRAVGFKLGEGATLNELAYVMMVQGQHQKAKELVQALDQIANDIEYPAMQMAAKQLFFDMAREQGDWAEAARHLKRHREIATDTNNARALLKNQMLELSLRVDAGEIEETADLIDRLQQHIDQNGEIRMQPRLDWFKARIKKQQSNVQAAEELLLQARQQALINEDGETIININNSLATVYLETDAPQKALHVLNESAQYKPFALPYLKLKAKAQEAMGDSLKALETMNLCQQQAADLWTPQDSEYLQHLVTRAQNASP